MSVPKMCGAISYRNLLPLLNLVALDYQKRSAREPNRRAGKARC